MLLGMSVPVTGQEHGQVEPRSDVTGTYCDHESVTRQERGHAESRLDVTRTECVCDVTRVWPGRA